MQTSPFRNKLWNGVAWYLLHEPNYDSAFPGITVLNRYSCFKIFVLIIQPSLLNLVCSQTNKNPSPKTNQKNDNPTPHLKEWIRLNSGSSWR